MRMKDSIKPREHHEDLQRNFSREGRSPIIDEPVQEGVRKSTDHSVSHHKEKESCVILTRDIVCRLE